MSDSLESVLKAAKITDAQRAGLWDLYHAAKNESDIEARLKTLQIPDSIKADLWDLKHQESSTPAPQEEAPATKVEPSAGYWEDRGIAGKVWHPATPPAAQRADRNVIGLPTGEGIAPEIIGPGALTVGNAVVAPGLTAAGRVAAGATAAAGQAAPFIKYEVVKHALQAVGVPWYLADAAAAYIGGRGGKGAAAAEGEAATATKASEAATAAKPAETTPLGFPKLMEKPLTPLELTRKLRAEHQAKMAAEAAKAAPAEPVAPSGMPRGPLGTPSFAQEVKKFSKGAVEETAKQGKPLLTSTEASLGMRLMKRGLSADDALKLIMFRRGMPKAWQVLPSDEEVERLVTQANQTGRMTRPQ